ncbi:MAG: Maf family protein [Pseudomonadota bacterium]
MSALVLASQSASRRAMLTEAGVPFTARAADVDERGIEAEMYGAAPDQIALALARAKALAVAQTAPDTWVLGSDSLVTVDSRRFDKPRSRTEAAEHLAFFSGKVMELHSAAALARGGRTEWEHADVARLTVRELSDSFIERYLDAEWPAVSGCVGVFRIEALGVQLFDSIEGSHFTVLGMPLLPVLGALRERGVLAA